LDRSLPPPRIGELEAALLATGLVHPVVRLDLRDGFVLIEVDPADADLALRAGVFLHGVRFELSLNPSASSSSAKRRRLTAGVHDDWAGGGPEAETAAERAEREEKEKRLYRRGLSYRCKRCGQPKKGHVCALAEGAEADAQPEVHHAAAPADLLLPQDAPGCTAVAVALGSDGPPLASGEYRGLPLVAAATIDYAVGGAEARPCLFLE